MAKNKGRVTGIGGIFIQSKDPEALKKWYCQHLGLVPNEYGSMFEFYSKKDEEKSNFLQWSTMSWNSDYFQPSTARYMINYRVENIEAMIEYFNEVGITVVDELESYEFGKFIHILDLDGNKVELWEPVDQEFSKEYNSSNTTHD